VPAWEVPAREVSLTRKRINLTTRSGRLSRMSFMRGVKAPSSRKPLWTAATGTALADRFDMLARVRRARSCSSASPCTCNHLVKHLNRSIVKAWFPHRLMPLRCSQLGTSKESAASLRRWPFPSDHTCNSVQICFKINCTPSCIKLAGAMELCACPTTANENSRVQPERVQLFKHALTKLY
jgi:hypothetical protein